MFRHLRRRLLATSVGLAILLLLLTAVPTAAASPFTATGCASGNFTCLRAHGFFVPRFFFSPFVSPFFVPQRFIIPQRFIVPHRVVCVRTTGRCFVA